MGDAPRRVLARQNIICRRSRWACPLLGLQAMPLHNGLPRLCDHVLPMFRFARATSIFSWKGSYAVYCTPIPISICYLFLWRFIILDYAFETLTTLAQKILGTANIKNSSKMSYRTYWNSRWFGSMPCDIMAIQNIRNSIILTISFKRLIIILKIPKKC